MNEEKPVLTCKTYTVADILATDGELFKFVKVNGTYRFCSHYDNHCQLVIKGETAQAAGLLIYWTTFIRMEDTWSTTLRIGCGDVHYEELATIFGIPVKSRWECD